MAVPTESEVTTTEAPEGAPSIEEAPEGAEAANTPEEVTKPEKEADEPDPLAEIKESLEELKRVAATKDELHPLISNYGRIDSLQATLDDIAKADPLATVNPTIEALQADIGDLVAAMSQLEELPAETRAALTANRAKRVSDRDKADLQAQIDVLKNVTPTDTETPQKTPEYDQQRAALGSQLQGYAIAKGVEWDAVVSAGLTTFKPGEENNLPAAAKRVQDDIDAMANESGATTRVAERAEAAGPGTPSRSGNATRIETLLTKLDDEGQAALSEDEQQTVADHLGVKLHP